MCSPSYSTYKPQGPLTSDVSIVSEQPRPLEEPDGVHASLCNECHYTNSQDMLPCKDIYKFSNPLFNKNKIEENTNIYNVESFYICMTSCKFHVGHQYGKRPSSEVPLKV